MMKFPIKNRWTGAVLFEAELSAEYERSSEGVKLGAAVKLAVKVSAYLAGAKNIKPGQLESVLQIDPAEIPVIPKIDAAILAAIEAGGTLDMSTWHGDGGTCGTTHCRAGWAVHKGRALEERVGSRPGQPAPHFFATNDDALADLRKCAAEQTA